MTTLRPNAPRLQEAEFFFVSPIPKQSTCCHAPRCSMRDVLDGKDSTIHTLFSSFGWPLWVDTCWYPRADRDHFGTVLIEHASKDPQQYTRICSVSLIWTTKKYRTQWNIWQKKQVQGGAPPVISWFIIPINYRYNPLINPSYWT